MEQQTNKAEQNILLGFAFLFFGVINPGFAKTTPPALDNLSTPTLSESPTTILRKQIPAVKNPYKFSNNPKQILARIGTETVTEEEVQKFASTLPPELKNLPKEDLYPTLIKQIAAEKAVLQQARKEGLAQETDIKAEIKAAQEKAEHEVLLQRFFTLKMQPYVSAEAIQSYYQSHYAQHSQEKEVHLRQIIVQTFDIAQTVIQKLQQGDNFSKLAAIYSLDRSTGPNKGGDIGWFTQSELSTPLQETAFSLKNMQYNNQPVQTNYGWVVIQKIEEREQTPPPLAEVKKAIRQQIMTEKVDEIYDKMLNQIQYIDYEK